MYDLHIWGYWGEGSLRDVRAVLQSALSYFEQYLTPKEESQTLIVCPHGGNGPYTEKERGPHGEIFIYLTSRDHYWAQYAFQFCHEFGHVMANSNNSWPKGRNLWFDEGLCDAATLFGLYGLTDCWQQNPPFQNWRSFAPEFTRYAKYHEDKPENDTSHRLPHPFLRKVQARFRPATPPSKNTEFLTWFTNNRSTLEQEGYFTDHSRFLGSHLLPLFLEYPQGWNSLRFLNQSPKDKDCPFEEYLSAWYHRVPVEHRPFVRKISAFFAISPA